MAAAVAAEIMCLLGALYALSLLGAGGGRCARARRGPCGWRSARRGLCVLRCRLGLLRLGGALCRSCARRSLGLLSMLGGRCLRCMLRWLSLLLALGRLRRFRRLFLLRCLALFGVLSGLVLREGICASEKQEDERCAADSNSFHQWYLHRG